MNIGSIVVGAVPAACFALALGILLTAPPRYLTATAVCGFVGRVVRDFLTGSNMGPGWATLFASVSVVVIAAAVIRRTKVPPVVMISGLLPLGAAGSTFDMILGFMRLPNLTGEALQAASIALASSAAKSFMTYLALSVGVSLGMAFLRFLSRNDDVAV